VSKDKAVTATPARTLHHRVTCACPADDLGEFTIYPPHERFYGRCDTCHEVRWQVEYHEFDDEAGRYRRTTHCGCCTHRHNLSNGGHDARCLADEQACSLRRRPGERELPSTVHYPGPR
jgi:hypothetical protein